MSLLNYGLEFELYFIVELYRFCDLSGKASSVCS